MKKTQVPANKVGVVKAFGVVLALITLANVPGLNGADNMPGVGTTIWGIPKEDLETIQTPGADGVTITTAHVPKAGCGFYKFYNSLESGELKGGMKGGIDGRYQEMMYEGFIPGIRAIVASNLRKAQNVEMIWIVKEANGQLLQLGDDTYPAYLSQELGTGKAGGDQVSGYNVKIKSYGITSIFYAATIPLRPAGAFTGDALITIGDPGVADDTIEVAVESAFGGTVSLGTYTVVTSDTADLVATGLAAAITAGAHGFTAAAVGPIVTVTVPTGSGTTYDGFRLEPTIVGDVTIASTIDQQTF